MKVIKKEELVSLDEATLSTKFTLPGSSEKAFELPVVYRLLRGNDAVQMALFVAEDTKPRSLTLMLKDYGDTWFLSAQSALKVETPHGTIVAYDKGDEEYPGVMVEIDANNAPDNQSVALAMIEYIPGGEGVSDYDPRHTNEMMRQDHEVPPERRERREDFPDQEQVTAGFVTRAWPDEIHQQDFHYRCFHYGYKRPWQSRDELETAERRAYRRVCEAETRYGGLAPETKQAHEEWEQAKRNLALADG